LTVGTKYYIQVGYATTAVADQFNIAVSTVVPTGSTITNPLPLTAFGQSGAAGGCTAATCPMVPDECPINETYVALNSTSGNCSSSNSTCSSIIQTTCKNCPTTTTSCGSSTSGGKAYCYPCASYLTTNLTGLTLASTASYPNSGYPAYNSNIPGTTVAYSAMCSPT